MSAELAASFLRTLQPEEFRVLTAIELGMVSHEFTPFEQLVRYSSLNADEAVFRLRRLHRLGLVRRRSKPFLGYALNMAGYDCLALNALVKGGHLEALGKPLGVGKESDVYDALGLKGERVAVKFHRVGRTSFRQTRRRRVYVADRRHISWLYESRLAAEREFQALQRLYAVGVAVPKPLAWNRHVIVMEIILGAELADYYELPKPAAILQEVLDNIRTAYVKAGLIHADLSEYNVVIKPDGHILLIDWPQSIEAGQEGAQVYIKRDVESILGFFRRKFKVRRDPARALRFIKGSEGVFPSRSQGGTV
ncbi:MAG: RIO1 family regulatory kinase/ATPase [Candidatus Bathyarchaeia archaeon]